MGGERTLRPLFRDLLTTQLLRICVGGTGRNPDQMRRFGARWIAPVLERIAAARRRLTRGASGTGRAAGEPRRVPGAVRSGRPDVGTDDQGPGARISTQRIKHRARLVTAVPEWASSAGSGGRPWSHGPYGPPPHGHPAGSRPPPRWPDAASRQGRCPTDAPRHPPPAR